MRFVKHRSSARPPASRRRGGGLGWPRRAGWWVLAAVLLALVGLPSRSFGAQPSPGLPAQTNNLPGPAATNLQAALAVPATNALENLETNRMIKLDDLYKLAIGDHLSFRIIEDQDDPKDLLVTDSGEIEVPWLGRYSAVGKTCKEVATELKARLEEKYYYHATVVISVDAKLTRGLVYLVGPLRSPGPLELPKDETLTLSKAILRAGGFMDLADQKHVRVTRDGKSGVSDRQVFIVNVYQILNQGETDKDMILQPGDLIYVPERLLRF